MSKWTNKDRLYSSGHFDMEDYQREKESRQGPRVIIVPSVRGVPQPTLSSRNDAVGTVVPTAMAQGLAKVFHAKNRTV